MTEILQPCKCGCGGEAEVYTQPLLGCYVICGNCGMRTRLFINRAEAIEAWNTAMSGNKTGKRISRLMAEYLAQDCFN